MRYFHGRHRAPGWRRGLDIGRQARVSDIGRQASGGRHQASGIHPHDHVWQTLRPADFFLGGGMHLHRAPGIHLHDNVRQTLQPAHFLGDTHRHTAHSTAQAYSTGTRRCQSLPPQQQFYSHPLQPPTTGAIPTASATCASFSSGNHTHRHYSALLHPAQQPPEAENSRQAGNSLHAGNSQQAGNSQ